MVEHYFSVINSKPGIQRDGTQLDSDNYTDGQWTRFYRGRPRKMGGYELIDTGNNEIMRNIFEVPKGNSVDIYIGRPSSLSVVNKNFNGVGGLEIDRTPVTGFVPDPLNQWSFDLYSVDIGGTPTTYIIAQVSANSADTGGTAVGPVFYGNINTTTPLTQFTSPQSCSGGVLVVPPYLFIYGNDGTVAWTNDLNTWSDTTGGFASIAGTKIVAGSRTRGGGAPAALFWSLNSLIRATFAPGATPETANAFTFDTIRDDISILSSDCIVEYNQMYFWVGNGVFYFYNGVVQVLPNNMNSDFFFNNLNFEYRERIWGIQIARWKEIWWCYPTGENTECNKVIIYDESQQIWYDSNLTRVCGFPAQIFPYPLMCDSQPNRAVYSLWMHEIGTDKVEYNQAFAIPSYFETNIMTLGEANPNTDRQTRIRRIEPNFVQTGDMTVSIRKRAFANSVPVDQGPYIFNNMTEKIDTDGVQGRQYSFIFTSNVAGGFYQMGKVIINWLPGDVTPNS